MTEFRCDFDGPLPADLEWRVGVLTRHQRWTVEYVWYRKTRRGWHVIVRVAETVAPIVTVAVQAMLGSDWKRENYNLARAGQLANVPPSWREARRWNALYTSHTQVYRRGA